MFYRAGQRQALAALGLSKFAGILATPTLEQIRALNIRNNPQHVEAASQLARAPGAFSSFGDKTLDLGHPLSRLGGGGEGSAHAMAHPRYGINSTKVYHPQGITTQRGAWAKRDFLNQAANSEVPELRDHIVRLLGSSEPEGQHPLNPRVLPAHHMELVPGLDVATALTIPNYMSPSDYKDFSRVRDAMPGLAKKHLGANLWDTSADANRNWVYHPDHGFKMVDFGLSEKEIPSGSGPILDPRGYNKRRTVGDPSHAYEDLHGEYEDAPTPGTPEERIKQLQAFKAEQSRAFKAMRR